MDNLTAENHLDAEVLSTSRFCDCYFGVDEKLFYFGHFKWTYIYRYFYWLKISLGFNVISMYTPRLHFRYGARSCETAGYMGVFLLPPDLRCDRDSGVIQARKRDWPNAGSILRLWPIIEPTLGQCVVFVEMSLSGVHLLSPTRPIIDFCVLPRPTPLTVLLIN